MGKALVFILVVLAIITVVGHLVWIALAWFFRLVAGHPNQKKAESSRRCVHCYRWTSKSTSRCQWCGRLLLGAESERIADLVAVERQIKRWEDAGVISASVVQELLSQVRADRDKLVSEPVVEKAVSAADSAAPVPSKPEPAVDDSVIVAQLVPELEETKPTAAALSSLQPGKVKPPIVKPAEPGPTPAGVPPITPPPATEVPHPEPTAASKPGIAPQPTEAAAGGQPPVPAAPSVPARPRKTWLETLTSFMEERNIRWAELVVVLVAGLLIVGPSVPLTISLWGALERIPYLKFFIFVGYSSVIFAAGLYAHHRWKLQYTSRGLLVIATLLVPLNFLGMASLSKASWSVLTLGAELLSLGVFIWLVALAAAVLVPGGRRFAVFAVIGGATSVLAIAHLGPVVSRGLPLVLAGALTVGIFGFAVGGFVWRLSRKENLDAGQTNALFALLGTAVFSLAVPIGLLCSQSAQAIGLAITLDHVCVPLALAALPILACGLAVMQGTSHDASLAAYRTSGTAVVLVGIFIMLAVLGMAWPQPLLLIGVGLLNAATLILIAFRYRLPVAQTGAIACLGLAYLAAYHTVVGHVPLVSDDLSNRHMIGLALGMESGAALVGLCALLGCAAEALIRLGRRRHARLYAGGAGIVAIVSLLLVTFHGFHTRGADAPWACFVYSAYGIGSLVLNARFQRRILSYFGLILLVGSTLWALWWWQPDHIGPTWAAVLAAHALVYVLAAVALWWMTKHERGVAWNTAMYTSVRNRLIDAYRLPLLRVAEIVAPLGLAVGLWTAWQDRAVIQGAPAPVITSILTAALYFTLAWGFRSAARTWVGSAIVLGGLYHTLVLNFDYTGWLQQPRLDALLAHATLAVVGGIGLESWLRKAAAKDLGKDLRRAITKPLGHTALVSSTLALPMLVFSSWEHTLTLSLCLFWLAAIWAVIAWTNRWPRLFAACQAVVTFAVIMGTTAWLERYPWNPLRPVDLADPRCLQTYGIALGLLTLVWLVFRLVLRRNKVARELLDPGWLPVDTAVGCAVTVAQLSLLAVRLFPGCWSELTGGPLATARAVQLALQAVDSVGWLLVAVLGVTWFVALWHRWRLGELTSAIVVFATVPWLVAGRFTADLATASALRWTLAVCFILGSAIVWQRARLMRVFRRIGARFQVGTDGPRISRTVLLATTVLPVVVFSLVAACLQLGGREPAGPVAGSLFDHLGPTISYLVPLLLVAAGLVGFALRESSAGYAFSAGLVVQMIVTFGFLLRVDALGIAEVATLLQLITITAAVWALVWLVGRRRLNVWREGSKVGSAHRLMSFQLGIGASGAGLLLVPAVFAIVVFGPGWHTWAVTVGSWVSWLAVGLVVAAAVYRHMQAGRRIRPNLAGAVGMTIIGLLACTVRSLLPEAPEWGYRTLMLGCAAYSLFVVLATWWVAVQRTLPNAQGPPQALLRMASAWVSVAGLAALLLGLKAALLHGQFEERLWAAAAIALASVASAAMAVWRRRETWAFIAALGVNLAGSLVVWYFERRLVFEEWWILLVQANVIASAAVALVWLAARKKLYELRELTIRTSPLLSVQTVLGALGMAVLLVPPVIELAVTPSALPNWALRVAEPQGWIALLLTTAAVGWYLRQVRPQGLVHAVAGLALGVGVLGACYVPSLNTLVPRSDWLSYHVLTVSWVAAGLLILATGWLGRNLRLNRQADPTNPQSDSVAVAVFPARSVQAWVTGIGVATVILATIWSYFDPYGPWWSAGSVLGVAFAAALLALWRGLPGYVYFSGILLNVAGSIVWMHRGSSDIHGFIHTNVLCLAIGSAAWTVIGLAVGRRGLNFDREERMPPFAHASVLIGLVLLAALAGVSVLLALIEVRHPAVGQLAWIALGAIAAAAGLCFWDRRARFPLAILYFGGLVASAMGLDARRLTSEALCWNACLALALFVLLVGVCSPVLRVLAPLWRAVGVSDTEDRWSQRWFLPAQAVVAGLAALLSAWISVDFLFDAMSRPGFEWLPGRMVGPLTAVLLTTAAIISAVSAQERSRSFWQYATFGVSVLTMAELGWAWLRPDIPLPWLHRTVILMVGAVVTTIVAGLALPAALPRTSNWTDRARRCVPALSALALLSLLGILLQELFCFELPDGTPLALPAVIVVAAGLVALVITALTFAVVPRWDPLRLSERGRQAYVYAAEALAGLVGLHLWFTMPWLFRLGIMERYWMLIVLGVAFGGAALSELFHRRGMPVLSQPLERTAALLPLAPAIGFFIPADVETTLLLAGKSPALWFLGGLFYGFLAATRNSRFYGMLSLIAGVIGFWALWSYREWGFVKHPQLWLIPVGLAILAAEYLNRDRLNKTLTAVFRYVALSLIYLSSTAEYIRELGDSLWLPLVLIGLSVLGVLVGVVLRIRSFLVVGITFLLLVMVTMVKYAAVDQEQTWILWVFCIALGAGLITTFAVFEKRREDILAAVKRFRQWER